MKIRQVVIVSMLALLCLGAFFIAGCAKPEEEANVIKIGVAGPMQFIHGQHHMLGAQMAADEINEAGGIKIGDDSYRIELVKIDTNELLSVDDAASAVEKALAQNNIDLLVGTIRTEAAVAIQELMMDHQKIYITCGASFKQMADKVAEDYDRYKYWFRITPMNGEMLAKASLLLMQHVGQSLKEDYGVENLKVAVVCEEAAAGDALAAAAEQAIPAFGFELAGVWRPSPQATDMTAELTAIKDSGAQLIYTYLSSSGGVTYSKQWGELQIPAASAGINVEAQSMGFIEATDGYGNYELSMNFYAPVDITGKTVDWYEEFLEKAGEFPTYNAGTYDAVYVYKEAAEKAGTLDVEAVVAEMEKTEFASAAGIEAFDENHDLIWGPGYVTGVGTQWQDGELKCVWPYDWEGITYPGTVKYLLPPWVEEALKD